METHCVRCQKTIDTVQGYKFSSTEYLCVTCYDEYKAERKAKAKKQHKNPLLEQFGTERTTPADRRHPATQPSTPQHQPAPSPPPAEPVVAQPAAQPSPPATPAPAAPAAQPPAPPKAKPSVDLCDVCKKPIPDFKVPLPGGKKVCMSCNEALRALAKTLAGNIKCPHCGKEIQVSQE
jgi:predicted RNA-binding Zn-ribbon protein involved in translation (DUF1610 family)